MSLVDIRLGDLQGDKPFERRIPRIDFTMEPRHPGHEDRVILATKFADELAHQYPSHKWRVGVTVDRSMIRFTHDLVGWRYGMQIRTDRIGTHHGLVQAVRHFAGEFLERHGIPRGRIPDMLDAFQHTLPHALVR